MLDRVKKLSQLHLNNKTFTVTVRIKYLELFQEFCLIHDLLGSQIIYIESVPTCESGKYLTLLNYYGYTFKDLIKYDYFEFIKRNIKYLNSILILDFVVSLFLQ